MARAAGDPGRRAGIGRIGEYDQRGRQLGLSRAGSGPAPQNVLINPVIIVTPGRAILIYNGTPAAGNLIESIAATSGTDAFGNSYIGGGDTVYVPGSGTATLFSQQGLFWYTGPVGGAGPWIQVFHETFFGRTLSYVSITGGTVQTVFPSGDITGVADSASITGVLSAPGKICILSSGTFYIDTPILLDSYQSLIGSGYGSLVETGSSFTGSYMVELATPASSVEVLVQNVRLWPTANSITGCGGVQLDNTGFVASGSLGIPSTAHVLDNVLVILAGGDGFHFDNHVQELRAINCASYNSSGYGFYLGNAGGAGSGCTDSVFVGCTSGHASSDGWHVLGANNLITSCESWGSGYSGAVGGGGSISGTTQIGFYVKTSRTVITNCKAQQNALHGYQLDTAANYCALTGNDADSNGAGTGVVTGVGILVNAATNCAVTGNTGQNALSPGNQIWGIQQQGTTTGTCYTGNTVSGTSGLFNLASGSGFILLQNGTSSTQPVFESGVFTVSGTGTVELFNQGSSPAAVSGAATVWADSNGFPRFHPDSASSDTNAYEVGQAVYNTTADQTITPTAVTDITGLSQTVGGNGAYYFRGIFRMKQGAVANVNQNIGFSGPAVTNCVWYYSDGGVGSTMTSQKVVVGSLTTVAIAFPAVNDEQYVEFEGTVTFATSGTFKCQAQAPTAGDNFVVQAGCIFIVRPVQ